MDLITELRRASTIALKAHTDLIAITPRIFGYSAPALPTWPFVKHGAPIGQPRRATCLRGEQVRHTLHAYCGPLTQGKAIVETGEDHAGRLSAAIKAALDTATLTLPSGAASLTYINEQRLQEAEADTWHIVIEFRAKISA